jgi:uncharacterized protein
MGGAQLSTPQTIVTTWQGREIDLLSPVGWRINIRDIARGLACTNRFNGQTVAGPYSVAQHCCVVVKIIQQKSTDAELALLALLHDAHEAYTGDIARPMQKALDSRKLPYVQNQLDVVLLQALGIEHTIAGKHYAIIHEADHIARATEWRDLMATPVPLGMSQPANFEIKAWPTWHKAEDEFLKLYEKLAMKAGIRTPFNGDL